MSTMNDKRLILKSSNFALHKLEYYENAANKVLNKRRKSLFLFRDHLELVNESQTRNLLSNLAVSN